MSGTSPIIFFFWLNEGYYSPHPLALYLLWFTKDFFFGTILIVSRHWDLWGQDIKTNDGKDNEDNEGERGKIDKWERDKERISYSLHQ